MSFVVTDDGIINTVSSPNNEHAVRVVCLRTMLDSLQNNIVKIGVFTRCYDDKCFKKALLGKAREFKPA